MKRLSFLRAASPNRRFQRPHIWWLALLILTAVILADQKGWLLARQVDDLGAYHGRSYVVVGVISGNIIEIEGRDALKRRQTTQVRLWGVAAPQPPRPGRDGEPMWHEAMSLVESLVLGHEVVLRLESHRTRDAQGRVLAHVEHPEGGTLNELILESGFARRDEQWPHAMLTAYAQAENRAQRRTAGAWGR